MLTACRRFLVPAVVVVLAACSGSSKSGAPHARSTSPSTSALPSLPTTAPVNPDLQPNPIPYNVGERIGLPNGWLVQVTKVLRPVAAPGLPGLPPGQQYVGVGLTMTNDGTASVVVHPLKIFTLTDELNHSHPVVGGAPGETTLVGTYTPGAVKSGRLVFAVPVGQHLQMLLDGPAIHTQVSVFAIDPPTVPQQD